MAAATTYSLVNDLKDAIAGDPARRPLIVCGAGVSIAASNGRIPSWIGLIADGIARLESLDATPAGLAWAIRARAHLVGADAATLIALADEVTVRFGGQGDAEFANWLEGVVGGVPLTDSGLIEAILSLGCPVATTNYDNLIARTAHRREISWADHRALWKVISEAPECLSENKLSLLNRLARPLWATLELIESITILPALVEWGVFDVDRGESTPL